MSIGMHFSIIAFWASLKPSAAQFSQARAQFSNF
ncbi:hypothetical protein PBAL39_11235 [Pedobacter sp. BAL39]|nr:hypothetical protein PBAL39_11235 [Pedobacter sp. BAL39]